MKDVLKHGSFGPVCDPRMAKRFRISWMHARSSWIPTASVITWAFADTAGLGSQNLDCMYREGFVHASTTIRLGSLERVLPEHKMTDAGEIIQATFEEVLSASPWPRQGLHIPSHNRKVSGWTRKPLWIRLPSINESGRITEEWSSNDWIILPTKFTYKKMVWSWNDTMFKSQGRWRSLQISECRPPPRGDAGLCIRDNRCMCIPCTWVCGQ